VVPDVVVLGKPIGNAFPLAAVVTTPEIADSFNNGMEFFSTFGGNPVACAAGLAVLDVLEEENLQQHALRVGAHLIEGLKSLQTRYALIGDVRGSDCSSESILCSSVKRASLLRGQPRTWSIVFAIAAFSRASTDRITTSSSCARRWFSPRLTRIYSSRRWMPFCKKTAAQPRR